jgi:hypothetical protein
VNPEARCLRTVDTLRITAPEVITSPNARQRQLRILQPSKECHEIAAKHGADIADLPSRACLKHYQRTVCIQTQDYVHQPSSTYAPEFVRLFNLCYDSMLGSPIHLKKLLAGPLDEAFVIISGGQTVDAEMRAT